MKLPYFFNQLGENQPFLRLFYQNPAFTIHLYNNKILMLKKSLSVLALSASLMMNQGCNTSKETTAEGTKPLRLIVLDPGHFHADLLQKTTYDQVDSTVHVYAPDGPEVKAYLTKVEQYNTRAESPTNWNCLLYTSRCV